MSKNNLKNQKFKSNQSARYSNVKSKIKKHKKSKTIKDKLKSL